MARESVPVTRPAIQGSCIPLQPERAIQRTHAEYVMNRCHTYPSRAIYHCLGLGYRIEFARFWIAKYKAQINAFLITKCLSPDVSPQGSHCHGIHKVIYFSPNNSSMGLNKLKDLFFSVHV